MRKQIDPDDKYVVRLMFGCGHGHVLPPGFTHWESGEACPHGHSGPPTDNESYHLYGRLIAVPTKTTDGQDMWKLMCDNPNRWGHLPLAPPGAKKGDVIGTKEKINPEKVHKRRKRKRAEQLSRLTSRTHFIKLRES